MRITKSSIRYYSVLIAVLFSTAISYAGDYKAHEWGTFTTLHWPDHGNQLPWYQDPLFFNPRKPKVSDLPAFVRGNRAYKAMLNATARMETPVIYFYTDKKRTIDVNVRYKTGNITEFFPGMIPKWDKLNLIPPSEAGDLISKLPVDPQKPDNHYYEARAVPEAAIVHTTENKGPTKEPLPDEYERFIFYRGTGAFDTRLIPTFNAEGDLQINNYNHQFGVKHAWVVQTSLSGELHWKKVSALKPYDSANHQTLVVNLDELPEQNNPEQKIVASMVESLVDAGLYEAEAKAMVATWDEQWYREPGTRVFSIVAPEIIDDVLPLTISPAPGEIERVFVHRQEVLSRELTTSLEKILAPGNTQEQITAFLDNAKLGRFAQGAISAVAEDIGRRTTQDYQTRGIGALTHSKGEAPSVVF